jgi:hypothetical protein
MPDGQTGPVAQAPVHLQPPETMMTAGGYATQAAVYNPEQAMQPGPMSVTLSWWQGQTLLATKQLPFSRLQPRSTAISVATASPGGCGS